jgi:predicted MFS family arabinose efflux permease
MIGPLFGTFLLEGLDITYRMLFEIATFVMAAAIIFSMPLSKKSAPKQDSHFSFSAVREIARFPQIVVILIFCASSFGMILTIYPAFLNDRTMTATQIEILYFVFGISRVVTLASTARLARCTGATLIASTLTIAAGLVLSFFSHSILEFAAAMLLMGFGFSIIFPLTLEVILRRTPKEISGKVIGAYETTFGIGWTSGPIIAGLLSEFSGNATPYMAFFVAGIGVSILSMIKRKTIEPISNP